MTGTPLDLDVTRQADGHAVIAADGVIDFTNRDVLRQQLDTLLDEGHRYLIVDLTGVSLCDSSGLSVLIQAHRAAGRQDGWLRLVGAQRIVRRVLEITNLDRMMPVYDTASSARAATGGGPVTH